MVSVDTVSSSAGYPKMSADMALRPRLSACGLQSRRSEHCSDSANLPALIDETTAAKPKLTELFQQFMQQMLSLMKSFQDALGKAVASTETASNSSAPTTETAETAAEGSSAAPAGSTAGEPASAENGSAVEGGPTTAPSETDSTSTDSNTTATSNEASDAASTESPADSAEESAKSDTSVETKNGKVVMKTKDGFVITCNGKNQSWTIKDKNGHSTKIWGDPHVKESDGDKWDFQKQSSFRFGQNKITAEVTPTGDSGATVTKKITLYSGDERITITGIDKDKPVIKAVKNDRKEHDKKVDDGDVYKLHRGKDHKEEWKKSVTG